ncbi:MAG TPA: hypothetical protein VLB07_01385 [Woeseiaceae bacterium]|nr:hypothetical protein [Woeseiaceae bacterium]
MLPLAQVISGVVMVLLVLQQGLRLAFLEGATALAILAVVSVVVGAPLAQLFLNALVTWLPVMLLAAVMLKSRSFTLALQVAAIAAILATLGFFVVLGDPTVFWSEVLTRLSVIFAEIGLQDQADRLATHTALLAPQMTMVVVSSSWTIIVLVLALGYGLYRALPGKSASFGRFCDLNFGRVLALTMAVTSVAAAIAGADWLQNVAFVAFVIFWIQGLAIVHWLLAEKCLHTVVVISVYALLFVLSALVVIALAVVGYVDAWFDFRRRMRRVN